MKTMTRILGAAAIAAASVAGAGTAGADHDGVPTVSPDHVDALILPGQSIEIEKTIGLPNLPPVLDVCLVVDLSGSYNDDLGNIKALAPGIWDALAAEVGDLQMGLASFVDFPFSPWGSAGFGDYAYRLDQQLTPAKATWVAAVNAMATRSGNDFPESQYEALYQVATGAGNDVPPPGSSLGDVAPDQQCDYREDATKVVVLTTDAAFHNAGDAGPFPYPGASAAATTTALQAAGIKVIGLKAGLAGGELDALAAATGGAVVPTSSDSSDIADAILAALEAIQVEVSMVSDCVDPISTSFEPASQLVPNGGHAVFTETISVAADAPGGVYECNDYPLIDGGRIIVGRDDAGSPIPLVETKRILVPENFVTGGGNITNGLKGKNRAMLLNHGGNAGYMPDGTLVGHWNFNVNVFDVKIQTTEITALQFVDNGDPAPPEADANTAIMTADVRISQGNGPWTEGCVVTVTFVDGGEPQNDSVTFNSVDCGGGASVFPTLFLNGGNIQIHEGTK